MQEVLYMSKNNDEKVREYLEKEEVPEKLSPENIKDTLDEQKALKKRKGISAAGKITAVACAVALIAGSVYAVGGKELFTQKHKNCPDDTLTDNYEKSSEVYTETEKNSGKTTDSTTGTTSVVEVPEAPYMASAESYSQIYKMLSKSAEKYKKSNKFDYMTEDFYFNGVQEDGKAETAGGEESYEYDDADNAFDDAEYGAVTNGETAAVPADDGGIQENSEIIAVTEPQTETEEVPETETETVPQTETETVPQTETESVPPTETEEVKETETENTTTETTQEETENQEEDDFSDTYNQEENVLEADIVKTDGEFIYYIYNDYNNNPSMPVMNVAQVDNGEFLNNFTVDLSPVSDRYDNSDYNISPNVLDMYIYDDMLVVVGNTYGYYAPDYYYTNGRGEIADGAWYGDMNECFVSFYTHDENPELIGTYFQDGSYIDVRIAPDGFMYLTTSYNSVNFDSIKQEDNIERYVPECGVDDDLQCIPPSDILLPVEIPDETNILSYTVIGGIDLNTPKQFSPTGTKALAGYTGSLYMSENNIYTAVTYSNTDITRIAVSNGNIEPQASCTLDGYIKDQFSMSEYNGYFRVAVTINKNQEDFSDYGNSGTASVRNYTDNCVYVLDMDLNTVGYIDNFGVGETVKSVSFSGNTVYVVTYEQTDPLFAIDLSNPESPQIMDDFKILGYSTYMQNWGDGLLLGFGADADEHGIETGIKLVMFDNSDPYDLKEVGVYHIDNNTENGGYRYSTALYERKSLLIAPEKNLIGVPVETSSYYYTDEGGGDVNRNISEYMFFSYENGEFVLKGSLECPNDDYISLDRAVYIGNYVYAVSGKCFVSADIETLTEKDRVEF